MRIPNLGSRFQNLHQHFLHLHNLRFEIPEFFFFSSKTFSSPKTGQLPANLLVWKWSWIGTSAWGARLTSIELLAVEILWDKKILAISSVFRKSKKGKQIISDNTMKNWNQKTHIYTCSPNFVFWSAVHPSGNLALIWVAAWEAACISSYLFKKELSQKKCNKITNRCKNSLVKNPVCQNFVTQHFDFLVQNESHSSLSLLRFWSICESALKKWKWTSISSHFCTSSTSMSV